eukprot:15334417-Ditylum_brightwellii.AAC.2
MDDSNYCGTAKHTKNKFTLSSGSYYLCANSTTAFTSPTLHNDELSELQCQELTGGVYIIKQYKILLDQYTCKPNVTPKTEPALLNTLSYAKGSEPFKSPHKSNPPVAPEPDFDDKFDEPDDETIQD